jgi:hypothetical protein
MAHLLELVSRRHTTNHGHLKGIANLDKCKVNVYNVHCI